MQVCLIFRGLVLNYEVRLLSPDAIMVGFGQTQLCFCYCFCFLPYNSGSHALLYID